VDDFLWGTSEDLDVPKDSESSLVRFLFPHGPTPLELVEGRDEVGAPVLSEPSIFPRPTHHWSQGLHCLKQILGAVLHLLVPKDSRKGRRVSTQLNKSKKIRSSGRRQTSNTQISNSYIVPWVMVCLRNKVLLHMEELCPFSSIWSRSVLFCMISSRTTSSKVLD
jgi:hypothetical protein